jgi:hypothetical protein
MELTYITYKAPEKEAHTFSYGVAPALYEEIVRRLKNDFNMRSLLQDHEVVVEITVKVQKLT